MSLSRVRWSTTPKAIKQQYNRQHEYKQHNKQTLRTLVPLKGALESQGPPPLSVVTTTTVLSINPLCFRSTNT